MTEKNDFETVIYCVESFLKEKNTRNKLNHILEKGSNDWEKWLQIELEYYMEHVQGYIARREHRAIPDNRQLSGKSHMFVDLIFRKKMSRKDRFIYLELKCSKRGSTLLRGMSKDITKIDSIRNSYFEVSGVKRRSFWCVGFYQKCDEKSAERLGTKIKKEGYSRVHHKALNLCSCRGKNHKDTCRKIGLVIL